MKLIVHNSIFRFSSVQEPVIFFHYYVKLYRVWISFNGLLAFFASLLDVIIPEFNKLLYINDEPPFYSRLQLHA